jgi:hypothetical protein
MTRDHYDRLAAMAWGTAELIEEQVAEFGPELLEQVAYRVLVAIGETLVSFGPRLRNHPRNLDEAFQRHLEKLGHRRGGGEALAP